MNKRFKPGDKCIVISGFYMNMHVQVISYFSSGKVHVNCPSMKFTFLIEEDELLSETVFNSPLYKALR